MGATRLGYVGLGTIGLPVATRLAALPGVSLVVADLDPAALATLSALPNVTVVGTAAEVARQCDVLFACLPDPAAGDAVFLGAGGVLEAGSSAEGLVVIDNSTVSPAAAERFSRGLAERSIHYFECPVLGGVTQAVDGELFGVVSGPESRYTDTVYPPNLRYPFRTYPHIITATVLLESSGGSAAAGFHAGPPVCGRDCRHRQPHEDHPERIGPGAVVFPPNSRHQLRAYPHITTTTVLLEWSGLVLWKRLGLSRKEALTCDSCLPPTPARHTAHVYTDLCIEIYIDIYICRCRKPEPP